MEILNNNWFIGGGVIFVVATIVVAVILTKNLKVVKEKTLAIFGLWFTIIGLFVAIAGLFVPKDSTPSKLDKIQSAVIAFEQGLYEYAIQELQEICNSDFVSDSDRLNILKKLEQAKTCHALKLAANELFNNEEFELAKNTFEQIIEINPKDDYVKERINECVQQIKKIEGGQTATNNAPQATTNIEKARLYNSEGLRYSALGNNDKAIEAYNKAIELNPQYQQAYRNRAIQYIRKGNDYAALQDANKAIMLKPNDGDNYCTRGDVYNMQGNYEAAINDFTKAIELYDKIESVTYSDGASTTTHSKNTLKASVYYRRGLAHRMAGNKDAADFDFNQAKLLSPGEY